MNCEECEEKDKQILLLKNHISRLQTEIALYKRDASKRYYNGVDDLPYYDDEYDS